MSILFHRPLLFVPLQVFLIVHPCSSRSNEMKAKTYRALDLLRSRGHIESGVNYRREGKCSRSVGDSVIRNGSLSKMTLLHYLEEC
jgi:hypothetical protein